MHYVLYVWIIRCWLIVHVKVEDKLQELHDVIWHHLTLSVLLFSYSKISKTLRLRCYKWEIIAEKNFVLKKLFASAWKLLVYLQTSIKRPLRQVFFNWFSCISFTKGFAEFEKLYIYAAFEQNTEYQPAFLCLVHTGQKWKRCRRTRCSVLQVKRKQVEEILFHSFENCMRILHHSGWKWCEHCSKLGNKKQFNTSCKIIRKTDF